MPATQTFTFSRRLAGEALGTALLLATIVGSGIMGDKLAGGNIALALFAVTFAAGAMLIVLINVFGPISGAHFNPVVSLSFTLQKQMKWSECAAYAIAQIGGGVAGAVLAHLMFGEHLIALSVAEPRTGIGMWLSEFVATFGLLTAILGCARHRPDVIPFAVGLFVAAGFWFTYSTCFANPAVTIARALTDTFTGIRPADVVGFIAAQALGAVAATAVFGWFWKK